MRRLHLGLLSGLMVAGCTVGPNYVKPALPTPGAYAEHAGEDPKGGASLSRVTAETVSLDTWWALFKDPELDALIRRALADNLTLAQASARVRQAREQVIVAGAADLPTVSASTMAARVDTKGRTINGLSGGGQGGGAAAAGGAAGVSSSGFSTPNRLEFFSVGFNAAWEIDLFGAGRRGVEAARAQTEAAVWSLRDSQVSVISELANDYLQMRLAQARLVVLKTDLKRAQGVLQLIRDRFRAGFVTDLDVNQQRTQLASTQSQIPQVESQIAAQRHAVAVLLGLNPEALDAELMGAGAIPPAPPSLPAGLPSDLLQRRPDIRASERQLAAASAQIGSAVAAQFPTLNLTALPTYSTLAIADMFQKPSTTLISLAQGAAPLFEGGRLRANVRSARAAYDQAFASYKETAVSALREVEDAIVRYDADQRRWTSLNDSFKAAQTSFGIATQQYGVGLTDYNSVYQAQASLLQAQDQLTQADAALATDIVALYKALGGGWSEG